MKRGITYGRWLTLVAILVIVLALAACAAPQEPALDAEAPGGAATEVPAGDVEVEEEAPAEAEEAPAEGEAAAPAGATEILVWDQFGDDAAAVDQMIADFNAAHPDIVVRREGMPTGQMRDILRTAIDAGEGPDVIFYDTGPGFAGVLARAGMLIPLDEAYAQYGWDDRILPVAKQRTVFDGKAYGIGHQLEVVGMFYNERIFEELGLEVPETHEDVLALCDTISEAGLYPIAFGDAEKWPAGHTFSVFSGNIAGRDKLAGAISGEVPWTDPDFVDAIEIPFVEMVDRGCFNPDITALTYDDANALFYSGQAAMMLTGSWMIGSYSDPENMTDPVGFFFYPSVGGKPVTPPAGLGSGYFVTELADNPDAAFQFLDYLFSEENAARWLTEVGDIPPVEVDTTALEINPLLQVALDALQENADQMGYNIDVLTPENFNTMMFDGFQEVLVKTKTAEEQAADLQAAMEEAAAEGKILDITE